MSQVYLLIPGLVVPARFRNDVSSATLRALCERLGILSEAPITQRLGSSAFRRAVHRVWAWSVLTRRALPAVSAAYAWSAQNGPQLSGDTWRLRLARKNALGGLEDAPVGQNELDDIITALKPLFDETGFVPQHWDSALYLTRKKPWRVSAAPFETLAFAMPEACDIEGEDRQTAAEFVRRADCILSAGGFVAQCVWISGGGGAFEYVYPPTKIRAVLADDDTSAGWALAAGIPVQRIKRSSSALDWPQDAPQGERLAVITDLYRPWLAGDWQTWNNTLPLVLDRISTLTEAARKKGCNEMLVIGCGMGHTVTLVKKISAARSLLARLSGRKTDPADWLFDDTDEKQSTYDE